MKNYLYRLHSEFEIQLNVS